MPSDQRLDEKQLIAITREISRGKCTPLISNQVINNYLFKDHDVISAWANEIEFPLAESSNLSQVSQFLRVIRGHGPTVKEEYLDFLKQYLLETIGSPDAADQGVLPEITPADTFTMTFSELALQLGYFDPGREPNNFLHILANLPIPIYLTSSYHTFIEMALRVAGKKPRSNIYFWTERLRDEAIPAAFIPDPDFTPTVEEPLVYHILGVDAVPASLVLTEDNYFEFLEKILDDLNQPGFNELGGIIPVVRTALSRTALLMLGYNLYNWDFRAVFRGAVKTMFSQGHPPSFLIQLETGSKNSQEKEKIEVYLAEYFRNYRFGIYWGNVQSFSETLQVYCETYGVKSPPAMPDELRVRNREERATRPTVFVSYSHKDEAEKEKLLSHLGVLKGAGLTDPWSDDRIGAGAGWEEEIDEAISKAQVAILLVTDHFLNSEFILEKEVPRLLERRKREGLTIFPIIAKDCAWQTVGWLTVLNVKPKNGRPVWSDEGKHVDEDLAAIAREVADILKVGKPS